MKLNNSIKLAMANFSLFWKILIYKVFAIGLIVLMFLPILGIFNECLNTAGFYNAINNTFATFQSVSAVTNNIFACVRTFVGGIGILSSVSAIGFIYLIVLVFFISPFILRFSDLPASETTYSYMASLNKNAFMVNFFDSFGRSASYSAIKTLIEIPFWVVFVLGLYGILSLTGINLGLSILTPLIMFIYMVFLLAIKVTFFSGWSSSIVVFNLSPVQAFKKGMRAVFRRFLSTLSSFAVVTVVMIAVLYIFGLYSLIIIAPLSSLINTVFGQVLFFESQGMNYYISPDNIVMPRKLEQADSIRKVKDII